MDRYRRDGDIEIYHGQPLRANHVGSQEPGIRIASRNKDNNRAIRLINDNDQQIQREILQKYMPP
jgi:hypothetical protein